MEVLQPLVPLGNSGTVPRGQRLESPWSVLGRGFNERVLRFAWYLTSVCFLLVVGEIKRCFSKKSAMLVYVALCMSHREFLQCSLDALYRGATQDFCSVFRYSWEGFETNRGLRGCFLLPGGDKGVSPKVLFCSWRFLAFFFGMPCAGAPVYFAGFFSIFLQVILEKLWSVRVFFCSVL